jgi:hypothetical protein
MLIKDITDVEEISNETAASIHGGRFKKSLLLPPSVLGDSPFEDPINPGDDPWDDSHLYPGLGKQADNETPLF